MIWLVAILTIFIYVFLTIRKKFDYWKIKGVKYVKPKFLCGNLELIPSKSFAEKAEELYNAFPEERYYGIYQFFSPALLIKDPELIKQITIKEFDHFVNHTKIVSSDVDPFWSKNLFASRDEKWRDLRNTLSPSFTSSKMKIMYKLIDECARQFVKFFKENQSGIIEMEVKDALSRYTNDVIASTAFGLKCDSLKNRENEFFLMGKEATNFGGWKILKFFIHTLAPNLGQLLQIKIIPSKVAEYFRKVIENTVKTRKDKNIVRPDMIHLLMEAQKKRQENPMKNEITLDDITSQAFVFFLAGFDTISTLLSFTLYELAINPQIQKKLRDEINTITEKITYEQLLKMKYLDMVISESLRKWPPIVGTDREVTKSFTIQPKNPKEKPLHLEKGLTCWLPTYAYHRDPKHFPEPEKFDPERFSNKNNDKINNSIYIPFGAGPRNCIGSRFALLEGKLLVYHVVKNFEVVPVKKTLIPMVLDKRQINVAAKGGMWLGLKKI